VRAFLAVAPNAVVRGQLIETQQRLKASIEPLQSRSVKVTWTRPDTIHLTLKFFADLDDGLAAPMQAAIARAIGRAAAIAIPLSRLGAFPRPQAPRVLWLGPTDEWEQTTGGRRLAALFQEIEDACAALGLPRESKAWHPHLTLARVKEGERAVGAALASIHVFDELPTTGALVTDAISLIRSDAGRDGHTHTVIWSVRMAPE
jgi:RNA 2',3'-cyclic 3'-phosphodiesterase